MFTLGFRKSARAVAILVVAIAVLLGMGSVATSADEVGPVVASTDAPDPEAAPGSGAEVQQDDPAATQATPGAEESAAPAAPGQAASATGAAPHGAPIGPTYPVTLESNFARPYKAISSGSNSDFSQLDDLERIIKGSYWDVTKSAYRPPAERKKTFVYMSISRMENSTRVGRELVRAAKAGVKVRVIHGAASQSKESRALQKALDSSKLRDSDFKICAKGKSQACLSSVNGGIMHSKILLVNRTFTRDRKRAVDAVWTGSANLGGPSGEKTYNNGMTIYNDPKLFDQMFRLFADMLAERNMKNDTISYIKKNQSKYATSSAYKKDYRGGVVSARYGMFYSDLANVTIYPTPIYATPTNGKDPVLNLLNRVVPDGQCRIRLQQNRFKYRRIAVAYKLADLADRGCKISMVSFEDDLKVNRTAHCQMYIRVCRPILDVLKTANRRIDVSWAKPHDKTILVDALLRRNIVNRDEVAVDGTAYGNWGGSPTGGGAVRTRLVQAGSAALTGSNLVASDEVTTETTDAGVYDEYLQHWKAILKSKEIRRYPY